MRLMCVIYSYIKSNKEYVYYIKFCLVPTSHFCIDVRLLITYFHFFLLLFLIVHFIYPYFLNGVIVHIFRNENGILLI